MLLLEIKATQQSSQDEVCSEVSLHMNNVKNQVMFRVVPVKLYGKNNKVVSTHAFIDDGSSASLIEQRLADELGLSGAASELCLKWTGNTTKSEKNSRRVNVEISGVGESHKTFHMEGVRTIQNLALPRQTVSADKMKSRYHFLQDVDFQSMEDVRPELLIGIKHNKLGLPSDIREGSWNEPVATNTKLGWIVYGTENQEAVENFSFHIQECESERFEKRDKVYKQVERTEDTILMMKDVGSSRAIFNPKRSSKWRRMKKAMSQTLRAVKKKIGAVTETIEGDGHQVRAASRSPPKVRYKASSSKALKLKVMLVNE